MILKVGINKKGINGDVHTYIYDRRFSFNDTEEMKIFLLNMMKSKSTAMILMQSQN